MKKKHTPPHPRKIVVHLITLDGATRTTTLFSEDPAPPQIKMPLQQKGVAYGHRMYLPDWHGRAMKSQNGNEILVYREAPPETPAVVETPSQGESTP